jgi:hypothetical protein
LNYDLENFSKEDQINYLTSLWKRNFNEDAQDNLYHFAELLVDQISKTLKDDDRAFIGIPLQCRILAECFETDVQKSAQNQSELNSLVESIDRMNLDVANLYRLLLTKKRKIYEEEKKALSQSSDLADYHANSDIDNLELFLPKLAIKTIVSTKEEVHVLLGTQENSMKSKYEQDKKITKRMDHSVRFGLLDENAEGKVRFLHRTYAEYMMAEYLYTGFLLDDKKRNHLLDYDSARKLIIDKILVKEQYDGVQVFFDAMLKKIVCDNKEWENIVVNNLPERFYRLAEDLYRQSLRQNQKPFISNPSNALRISVVNRKEQIFNFLCDCLDATFDKSTVTMAVTISFVLKCGFDSMITLKHFCHQHIKIFRRFIGYYGDVLQSDDNIKQTYKIICRLINGLPLSGFDEHSDWNGSEQRQLVDELLDFMLANKKAIDLIFCSDRDEHYIKPMFAMFIFNENYDSHLHKFFKILSDSKFYSNENNFSNLLKNVLQSVKRKHRTKDRIGKTITILQTLGRQDVLIKMHGLFLTIEPDAFKGIYSHANYYKISHLKTNLSSVLKSDSYRMTHIHQAAFHGDTVAIEKILTTVKEMLTDPELRDKAEQVVKIVSRDDFGFTPFYLAAVCGHENLYRNMLAFLKDVHPGTPQQISDNFQTYLTATDGFVFHALSDAMESENLNMFETILNSVKIVLGQKCLLHLLKSKARENKGKIRYDHYPAYCWPTTIFGVASCYADLFHSLAKIVVQNGSNENYQDLDDLVFYFLKTESYYRFTLKHINAEILQGMLSLKGSNDWTKRLLEMEEFLVDGFDLLSKRLLKNFRDDQLHQFIEMIISNETTTDKSYWSKVTESVIQKTGIQVDDISLFLKCVSEKLGESFVVKLVTHDDKDVTRRSDELADCMFAHLSMEGQEEVKQHWKQMATPKINEIFFETTSKNYWLNNERTFRNADVKFYLKYGSDAQLSDFVRVVTSLHNVEANKPCSVWGYVFQNDRGMKEMTRKILKHVGEKVEIFGRNATKTLLLHQIDEEPLILEIAASWKHNVDSVLPAMLSHLPNEIQDEMQQYLRQNVPKFVDKAFSNPTLLMPSGQSYRRLNTLNFLLNFCNEKQLQLFYEKITFLMDASHTMKKISIWGDLFRCDCEQDDVTTMDKFLGCVSKKLGSKTVKKLILHADEGKDVVILLIASRGEDQMVDTMLNYLDDVEDRKKVQRKVDKHLRKKIEAPARKDAYRC